MNEIVRTYLITAARKKDKFVYYSDVVKDCNLNINTYTESGRDHLSKILGEISAFEDQQQPPRPLLSSLAIYKDRSKNDHGDGFYRLAAQLGKGKAKDLREELYAFSEAERSRQYWQNDDNFERFADLNVSREKSISDLFSSIMTDKSYRWIDGWHSEYMEFIVNVQKLRQNIIDNPLLPIESQKLYAGLSESFKDYDNFMWKWLKEKSNGISSRGQSVLSGKDFQRIINDETFRILAKASILEPTLENYDAFSEWWYNNPHINNRPLLINRAFAGCNYESLSSTVDNRKFWKVIDILKTSYNFKFRVEPNYNWFNANVQLTEWLNVELKTVLSAETGDPAKQRVWRNIFVWLIFAELNEEVLIPNVLHRRERPNGGFDLFPNRKPTFSGVVVDYEEQSRRQKDLGDAGEDLVKQYEIEYLKRIGLHEKAKSVKIVLDGEGYDVLSFDKQGNKKYIEVKTTTGEALAPFFLSENEVAFCRHNVYSYCIYRVYNYDEESNSGEFFEISNNVEDKILMQPTQYRVLLKKPAN